MTVPSSTAADDPPQAESPVPCMYCHADIDITSFEFRSTIHRLLSADCPACRRQVTIGIATWQRWGGSTDRLAT